MTIERAIEILDPEHREKYDGIEEVNEACRMGMKALEAVKAANEEASEAVANAAADAARAAKEAEDAARKEAEETGMAMTVNIYPVKNQTPYGREMRVYEQAVETWGDRAQILMAVEEMSELTKALLKFLRYGERKDVLNAIQEERADVEIMLNQLHVIFGDCSEWELQKLERLDERIKAARESNQ